MSIGMIPLALLRLPSSNKAHAYYVSCLLHLTHCSCWAGQHVPASLKLLSKAAKACRNVLHLVPK